MKEFTIFYCICLIIVGTILLFKNDIKDSYMSKHIKTEYTAQPKDKKFMVVEEKILQLKTGNRKIARIVSDGTNHVWLSEEIYNFIFEE